jgi:prevent-host-death family protein
MTLKSATDARRNFVRTLKEVEKGKVYIITWYGNPIARIAPVKKQTRGQARRRTKS